MKKILRITIQVRILTEKNPALNWKNVAQKSNTSIKLENFIDKEMVGTFLANIISAEKFSWQKIIRFIKENGRSS